MKISIVIPAYNEEKYIEDCLLSIEKYGKEISEVIVVSNGSTDNTANIVKKFPNIRLIEEPQKGLPIARNRGLNEANGDLIAFVDADTRLRKGWIEMVIKKFEKNKEIVSVSGPYVYYDASLFLKILNLIYLLILLYPGYIIMGYMATLGNFVVKKEALKKVGGFNNAVIFHGDDTDISKKLRKIGKVRYYLPLYLYSSARRLKGEGVLSTAYQYAINFIWIAIKNKPKSNSEYKEVR